MNCSNIIVTDENIPILVIRGLRVRGCDIVSIVEEARGCSDEIVEEDYCDLEQVEWLNVWRP